MHPRHAGFALLVAVLASTACVSHEARPAFRRGITIGDRGISVPLPPPSLTDAPDQEVDVDGSAAEGEDELVAGTVVHVEDLEGHAKATAELDAETAAFRVEALAIDLTANCLEVWLEAPDGRESERTHVRATITGATEVTAVPGCD